MHDWKVLFLFTLMVNLWLILVMFPQEKLKKNEEIVQCQVSAIITDISRRGSLRTGENTIQMLSSRIDRPFCKLISFPQGLGKNAENNNRNNQDVSPVISIKIPYIERLPPFTCWVHLAR